MTLPTSRTGAALLAAAALSLLSACSTLSSGMGGGELVRPHQPDVPVLLSWRSHDGGMSGTLVATLPDATYQGHFFQITQETARERVAPLWDGWNVGWSDWPDQPWNGAEPLAWTEFTTRYSGKVLANLRTDGGQHMRCRLQLAEPARGMAGGGTGACQLHGSGTLRARF